MPAGRQPINRNRQADTESTYKQVSNKEKQQYYEYIVIMHDDGDNNEKSVCNEKPFTSI